MNVFDTHDRIVSDYAEYIQSFVNISDNQIENKVKSDLAVGKLWPKPLLQFNPSYERIGTITDTVASGLISEETGKIFTGYSLYRHQVEAIKLGTLGRDFVVTSGTGSGKSLTYIATIFDRLIKEPSVEGIRAVIVYPMNALINSQENELNGYKANYEKRTGKPFPIEFAKYTGQEKQDKREALRARPPQVLLTNYMMLELLLTRIQERRIRDAIYDNLEFLVFDELHTYRGRQGSDIAMLIRRIRAMCKRSVTCIGTSATLVSSGDSTARSVAVARVASRIFGKVFKPDQIVNESLTRSLSPAATLSDKSGLAASIDSGIDTDLGQNELRAHPLAAWLENRVALIENGGVLERRSPMTVDEVVDTMGAESGVDEGKCRDALVNMLLWISKVNQAIQSEGSRYTILPFKLHQFFAQTGSVYTTLDQEPEQRFITLEPGLYKEDSEEKRIFPNVFSRESGHPFICVTLTDGRLLPREFRELSDNDDADDGYLIVGEEVWDSATDLEYLPEAWVKTRSTGLVPEKKYEAQFPRKIYYDRFGNYSTTEPKEYWGWFMKAPLLFDPTSGTFFDQKTNEATKLIKLGSEGRSTSTTITTFAILKRLEEAGLSLRDQKLLSFTDNRQDAALQAGHFNDFLSVVQLRAAIYRALRNAESNELDYSTVGKAIFDALNLELREYANAEIDPGLEFLKKKYEDIFKSYLFFRVLADLRRSWRIVLPNLEQCGLLAIDYKHLAEVAATSSYWSDVPVLRDLAADRRLDFLRTVLDYFRMEQAVHSENFLERDRLQEYEKQFRESLKDPWTLGKNERLPQSAVIRIDSLNRRSGYYSKSIGPTSGVGKWIKQFLRENQIDPHEVRGEAYRSFVLALLQKLKGADFLVEKSAKNERGESVPIFQLKIDQIVWKVGDGETVTPDVIKRRSYKNKTPKPNKFFRQVYSTYETSRRLRAADHSGQLKFDDRIERETRFRAEWYLEGSTSTPDEAKIRRDAIAAMYCSPTMELGIDIGGLSVVHMRNAPPNPANYAQRSGRAGRSGQGALIFTYCSSYSPHDRHYFSKQGDLVAGSVLPPRIDLVNKELLLTHLNALAISEVGMPRLDAETDAKASLERLVDNTDPEMPIAKEVVAGLTLSPATTDKIASAFKRTIDDFRHELSEERVSWFTDDWIKLQLQNIVGNLNKSMDRWRDIFNSSMALLKSTTQKLESGLLIAGGEEYRKYQRLQAQATRQLNLLRNEVDTFDLSEFYPYRYLAAEGFLPGYNFPSLPIRVFIPEGSASGEFISRPRRIALREFGPRNLIYHKGQKYQLQQMLVQDSETALVKAKISKKSGYFLSKEQEALEFCPFSGISLSDNANVDYIFDLLELSESRASEEDRISCEEEERSSRGFEINTYFSVDGDGFDRIRKAAVISGEDTLLNLRFVPAARLVQVNKKWRSNSLEGFPFGMSSGSWFSSLPDQSNRQNPEEVRYVKTFTTETADALYIEPVQALGLRADGVITLQYALKRAIESVFQVETSEIGVMTMGESEAPNILLYESAEGSLGILSQFVEDPAIFHRVIETAISICRFDDNKYLAPASYDDLLSYYNQRDHTSVNRFLIKDALERLRVSAIEIQSNRKFVDYEDHYRFMKENLDQNSSTEKVFIEFLYKNGLRLPDSAQKRVDGLYCQPDFYYEPRIWVFCDGTPHDDPTIRKRDEDQRQLIIGKGDEVWSWHYAEDLAEKIAKRPDIFKKIR